MSVLDLTVITISTNEADVLGPCVDAVFKNNASFEYIVFNNASSDGTASLLNRSGDPRLRIVDNPRKKGYIDNNNAGIGLARGRYVLLLNPDTVVRPDTFETMIRFMDAHPEAAVSTCRLTYRDGSPQNNVRRFPTPLTYAYRILKLDRVFPNHREVRRYLRADTDFSRTQEVDWFITAFFFMRKSVIDRIGPLDERLLQPFYLEDVEWCYRARRHGYHNYYVAETAIIHDYQQSSRKRIGKLTLVHLCNILLFFAKHGWAILTGKVKSV